MKKYICDEANSAPVLPTTRYDYYKYYDMKKHIYRLNYEERKRKQEEAKKLPTMDAREYFKKQLWNKD